MIDATIAHYWILIPLVLSIAVILWVVAEVLRLNVKCGYTLKAAYRCSAADSWLTFLLVVWVSVLYGRFTA